MANKLPNRVALKLINKCQGTLDITLSKPSKRLGPLLNRYAEADTKIKRIEIDFYLWTDDDYADQRPLTEDELNQIAFYRPTLTLNGEAFIYVTHKAPNGKHFTVRDVLEAVKKTEQATRGKSQWFGGVDIHHIYFEGIERNPDGSWTINWGS